MFKLIFKYIKYAWDKENKNTFFNPFRFMIDVINFIKYTLKGFNVFFNIVILILAFSFIHSCLKSPKPIENSTVQSNGPTSEELAVKKKMDDARKLIDVFIDNNKELLGAITSFKKSTTEDNVYVIATSKSPYNFSIAIENNKMTYINVVYKDMINLPFAEGNDAIKKKDYDYTMKTVKAGIKEKEAFQELQDNLEKFKSQFSPWNGSNMYLVQQVKQIMDDPHSFEHVNTSWYVDVKNHSIIHVQMTFRGKNVFGALVLNQIKAKMDANGTVLDYVWN